MRGSLAIMDMIPAKNEHLVERPSLKVNLHTEAVAEGQIRQMMQWIWMENRFSIRDAREKFRTIMMENRQLVFHQVSSVNCSFNHTKHTKMEMPQEFRLTWERIPNRLLERINKLKRFLRKRKREKNGGKRKILYGMLWKRIEERKWSFVWYGFLRERKGKTAG